MDIYSNTLIYNGEPFTKLVFRQVIPFVKKAFVTISEKSDDGTLASLMDLQHEFPEKIEIDTENVARAGLLTQERQKQLDKVPKGAWVLFLDSDDYWPTESLENIQMFMKDDVDALSVNPYQVVTKKYYDNSWKGRWFSKFFRNDEGVHYRYPWPRDMIFKNDSILYWKKNDRAPRVAVRFFHLANLMNWRFRDQKGFEEYKGKLGTLASYDPGWEKDLTNIFSFK